MALYNLKNVYDRKKFKEACNQMVLKNEYVELKKRTLNVLWLRIATCIVC